MNSSLRINVAVPFRCRRYVPSIALFDTIYQRWDPDVFAEEGSLTFRMKCLKSHHGGALSRLHGYTKNIVLT